jgi:very-short-patch-repair endonuclease
MRNGEAGSGNGDHPPVRMKTTARIRGTTRQSEASARAMRRDLTPAERVLWHSLRDRKLDGLRFRCQHPLGPFILDFCCPERKLAIELDGAGHDAQDQREYDESRSNHLCEFGYQMLRFRNEQVFGSLNDVLDQIREAAQRPMTGNHE